MTTNNTPHASSTPDTNKQYSTPDTTPIFIANHIEPLDLPQGLLSQDPSSVHLPHRQITLSTARRNTLPTSQTAKSKIRFTTKTAKDVAHVVFSLYTVFEGAIPVLDDPLDDFNTGVEDVRNSDVEAVLLSG